jgi:3-methylcrotonyl-CoA carboxylase alpha subunit
MKSLLIANRGEIACRIIKTARAMGLRTIAVHSDVDANAQHVKQADEAYLLGGAAAADSYLRAGRILKIATEAGADAIHPGYGFLSENADFSQMVQDAGMVFVGPPADAIRAMGSKDQAKAIMADAGVPVVPGYHGTNQDEAFLKRKAYEIGYPVLIKAVAGGGGKGMRRVDKAIDFDAALEAAKREAQASFGNDIVLIERFVATPRHIEIQVFADNHGNVVHLGERDCSMQRRHQKVLEEAPAPGMSEDMRATMGEAACAAARAVSYSGAGTVEFIVDASDGLSEDGFFFMEMNTRLQVEHPVTEAVTGQDLVEWQLRVARGEELPLAQKDISLSGHAIEARVYAETPEEGFLPSTGTLLACDFPDTIRIDSGVVADDTVSPHYDPMIAKLIASAQTREEAFAALDAALADTFIAGVNTNIAFLRKLLAQDDLMKGSFDTSLIDENLESLTRKDEVQKPVLAAGVAALLNSMQGSGGGPFAAGDGFCLWEQQAVGHDILLNGEVRRVEVSFDNKGFHLSSGERPASDVRAVRDRYGDIHTVHEGRSTLFAFPDHAAGDSEGGDGAIRAPMNGKVVGLSVSQGDSVEKGDMLFAVEAMKMEHAVVAPFDGTVNDLAIALGDQVDGRLVALNLVPVE